MDLEQYANPLYLMYFILLFEVILIFFIICTMLVNRYLIRREERFKKKYITKMTEIIQEHLLGKLSKEETLNLLKKNPTLPLIDTVEQFNKRFVTPEWLELRQDISEKILYKFIRSKATAKNWTQRFNAFRAINVDPSTKNTDYLIKGLNDTFAPIRYLCADSAALLKTDALLDALLKTYLDERGLARNLLKDSALSAGSKMIQLAEKCLIEEKDPKKRAILINLLNVYPDLTLLPLVSKDVFNAYPPLRFEAISVLGKLPSEISSNLLITALNDENSKNRAQAAIGLGNLRTEEALEPLTQALFDPKEWVRIQAGIALIKLGERGVKQLVEITPANRSAYDTAQYVLALPQGVL